MGHSLLFTTTVVAGVIVRWRSFRTLYEFLHQTITEMDTRKINNLRRGQRQLERLMENLILRHAPNYWDKSDIDWHAEYLLENNSKEYQEIQSEIRTATGLRIRTTKIYRIQNLHDLGQTLVRAQLYINAKPGNWYRVRRFVKLGKQYRNAGINYNLDPRRCGMNTLNLYKRISSDIYRDDIVFVVQVVTSEPYADIITPECSAEYFIDYLVTFD